MKVFLDTNIIIDFCAEREDFFHNAALLFQLAKDKRIELLASATTFVNSFYILRREYPHAELYERLKSIASACTISPSDEAVIERAFEKVYPDFEDAVQYFSAKAVKADVIITRNKEDFAMADENEVMTPKEFLDSFFS